MTPNASWDQCKALAEKHTPGPWAINCDLGIYAATGTQWAIASVGFGWPHQPDRREAEANAHLIAAAPELLEALEYLVGLGGGDCLDMARAAIAKARGQS